jgi:hypothetical protein
MENLKHTLIITDPANLDPGVAPYVYLKDSEKDEVFSNFPLGVPPGPTDAR